MIKENLEIVEKNITDACKRAKRARNEVELIAVSKTKPVEMIIEAYNFGQHVFGENRVQEMNEKIPELSDNIKWHLIGHLQRNKVKQIIGKTCLIHSVESDELAADISKQSEKAGIISDILVEVNIANEASKFGVLPEKVLDFIRTIAVYPGIRIMGLMTVAPITENSEENRQYFRKMKQLSVDIKAENIDNVYMDFLSMGMTGDYIVAIEEGATHVRVGTGIFGHR